MKSTIEPATSTIVPHPLRFSEIRIENTNNCGFECFFCPRESLTRPKGIMPVDDFERVVDRVNGHTGRLDLHGFGEPLIDKLLPRKVRVAHSQLPGCRTRIITTLGIALPQESLFALVDEGIDEIEISFYGTDRVGYQRVHGVDAYGTAVCNIEWLADYIRKTDAKTQLIIRDFPVHDEIHQDVVPDKKAEWRSWLNELGVSFIRERALHNFGDGRRYNAPGQCRSCSIVWGYRRRILQVTWDLDVIPCCFDFNATVVLGNLRHQTVQEIFEGETYSQFIHAHLTDSLDCFPVCKGCERCFRP